MKGKIKLGVIIITVLCIMTGGIVAMMQRQQAAQPITYYVSPYGDDLNKGTSEDKPWKTLAKVSSLTFKAGDRILLERGHTWKEELILNGNGTSEQPIELSSYGEGHQPIISPETIDSIAILLEGVEGWKITDLHLMNAWEGIRLQYDRVYDKTFIWIENMTIENMNHQYNSDPKAYNHTSAGIAVKTIDDPIEPPIEDLVEAPGRRTALSGLTIKNVKLFNCDTATWFGAPVTGFNPGEHLWTKDIYMENVSIDGGGMWGFDFHFIDGGRIVNLQTNNTGYESNPFGSAAVVVAYAKNMEFKGGRISNARRHEDNKYDGVGFDIEGVSTNIALRNMTIIHTDGAGIFHYKNSNLPATHSIIEHNIVAHFGENPGNSRSGIDFHGGSGVVKDNRMYNSQGRPQYTGRFDDFTFENNSMEEVAPDFIP